MGFMPNCGLLLEDGTFQGSSRERCATWTPQKENPCLPACLLPARPVFSTKTEAGPLRGVVIRLGPLPEGEGLLLKAW